MNNLCTDVGYLSINKYGEQLCGDHVEIVEQDENSLVMVLADGLGSGVKANILSTLTSKILCTMVANEIELDECVETILQSLPICKVRKIAYSTFSVIHVNSEGQGYLFEFDNPQAIYYHNGKCQDFEREKLKIIDKTVYKTNLNLSKNDVIIIMSDGVIHAGIGYTLNLGWQREDVMKYLDKVVDESMSARCIACLLAGACNDLYIDKPSDDTTVAAVKVREELKVNILVGPPVEKEKDNFYIKQFLDNDGKKVVCGGTSSQIVAKYLDTEVKTSFDFLDKDLPPIGFIDGIDLTTEGVLTLRKLLLLSEKYLSTSDLSPKYYTNKDGASLLAKVLFEESTFVRFFVGQSINAAHQGLPIDITMKLKLVEALSNNLKTMGKSVEVNYD